MFNAVSKKIEHGKHYLINLLSFIQDTLPHGYIKCIGYNNDDDNK